MVDVLETAQGLPLSLLPLAPVSKRHRKAFETPGKRVWDFLHGVLPWACLQGGGVLMKVVDVGRVWGKGGIN